MKTNLSKSELKVTDRKKFTDDIESILKKYPVLKTKNIMVEFSNRLRTAAGNVSLRAGIFTIKISTKNVKVFGIDNGIGTLRHEVAHILDFLKNGKFGHGPDFKRICADMGGIMNSQMAGSKFANCATDNFIYTPFKYEYQCKCGISFQRKGKIRNTRQVCMKCRTLVSDMKMKKL